MRKAIGWVAALAMVCTAIASSGGPVGAEPTLAPAATVTSVVPTVLGLGVTTNVVLTGTGFVPGTSFSSSEPSLVINTATVDSATQVTFNVTAPSTPIRTTLRGTAPGEGTQNLAGLFVRGSEGTFFPVTPVRAADTRLVVDGRVSPIGAGESRNFTVVGIGEVPSANVAAVLLNVTVTAPGATSFVTVYPAGGPVPVVSNLNFVRNQTIPNQVTVGVGAGGQISVYNDAGFIALIIDIVGYYVTSSGPVGAGYAPRSGNPRVVDTRATQPVAPFQTFNLTITGAAAQGLIAAVYNVTVDQPTADGFITTFPTGSTRPNASSVNFTAGQPSPNLVTVKIGADDMVSFYNGSPGTVHLILDGVGFYTTSPNSFSYIVRPVPTGPFRLWDSRVNLGYPLEQGETVRLSGAALPIDKTVGVIANATVTAPSVGGYATVFPAALPKPQSSSLNFTANETRANQVIPALLVDTTRDISVYNDAGTAHYIIDVFAYLQGY